jgi:triosephosphate isomerase (TIM)
MPSGGGEGAGGHLSSIRLPLIAGNWKMHMTGEQAKAYLARFLPALNELTRGQGGATKRRAADVVLCPPFTALRTVIETTLDSPVRVGAQNVHEAPEGPFTGEVSVPMLLELGVSAVVLGHSERRQHFGETDGALQRKVPAVLEAGLMPILCIGETERERDEGDTERKLRQQVQVDLAQVEDGLLAFVVIAYEPIWAIGTGNTATSEQAQEAIAFVRSIMRERDPDAADHMRILYGGSVNAANAAELLGMPDIDGALVGGASLDPDQFTAIVAAAGAGR